MISTSSPTLHLPRSTRPVATVPRPVIENTSSTGIRNGLSTSRFGSGMSVSTRLHQLDRRFAVPLRVALQRLRAEPRIDRDLVAGELVLGSSSRTSISTSSSSSWSSTMSHLLRYTTMRGTLTWRASSMCSRVCGIGPSAARDHQDRAVHLRGAGDHVLDVVRVARAVDVRVVALRPSRTRRATGDRHAALPSPRGRVVDLVESRRCGAAASLRQHLRDRRRQRRLAVVHVTDRPDVDVRLGALELGLDMVISLFVPLLRGCWPRIRRSLAR